MHAGGGQAVLLQSVRHRLLPPARKYVRGHLYWEGYLISPLSPSSSSSSSLSSSSSSCSVSAYLRLSADPIPPEAMWRFGRAMAASIGQLGAAAARSRSLSSSPTNRRPPAPLPGGAGHGFRV